MKILGLNCSPRKKNCYGVLELMQEAITQPDFEMEIVNLGRYKLKQCKGDLQCLFREPYQCIIEDDDLPALKEKFEEADGYIFSIPVYILTVPGILKTFMDRYTNRVHVYPFIGKYAALVSTLAGPAWYAEDFTMALMRRWMDCLGVSVSGELTITTLGGYKNVAHLGLDVPIAEIPGVREKAHELAGTLQSDMIEKPQFAPEAIDLWRFNEMKGMASMVGGFEKATFEKNGWFDKDHWSR
jgi:NAD(P)H-dependent FMN reductase